MPRKRKSDGDIQEVKPLKRHKPPADRNRASPSALVTACKDMPEERTSAIDEMAFTSLRNIKCDNLFNRLSQWLAGLYDPDSREVVIPGRGRLPVNEESVHRIMGVPRGDTDVEYHVPTEAQLEIAVDLFGDLGHAPKTMDVLDLILKTDGHDDNFKRLWLVLAASTVMAPTTSNKISTRWYPVLENIGNVQNLNWCKFIADQLHKALSKGKPTTGCLLFYNLLYIDAIDLTGLGIRLPNGPFAINVWTNELASKVLQMDVQRDKLSYGKLPLKPQFGQDYCLFGGLQGLDKFMRVHVPPNCSEQKFAKAAAIVGRFSSGMVGLMGGLVTDFMTLDDEENSGLSRVLESQLRGLSAAAGKTARTACATRSRERRDTGKQNIELSDYDCEADDGGGDAHSDDDPDYHVYFHGPSGGFEATGSGGPNAHEASGSGAANANLAASGAAFEDLSARVDGNDGNTTPVAGTDQPIESQIMISARSGTVSGDGVDNHPEMTDTQNEAAIDASVKRCGSALVHNLEKQKQYSRRHKKLRLPSPVLPTVSEQPSLDDTHRFIKGIVISELGLVCSDKGTASVIAEPTRKKQQPRKFSGAPSASAASLSINPGVTSEVAASVSQARSHISSSADVDSSDTSFSKKTMKTVRKVRVSSQASSQARLATRSSPRFAAKDPKERPNVDIEGSPKATSPIAILQDDSPVIISPDAGCGAVQELSAAANIAEVVEEFANVVISTEAESSVDQAQGKAPTGSASVAKDVQVEAQVDPVQVTVPEPVGVETQNDVVKDSAAGAVGVETQDAEVVVAERADSDFTPPSCSLGLGFTPPVPDVPTTSAVLTAVPAPAVNMAPQEPPAATPVVHMTTTAQVPAAVLALQSVTSQDLKKAGDKPIDAKPVSWAEPSESERRVRVYDADVEDDEVLMWVEQVESASARAKANNASQKDHPISPQYVTPVIQPPKDTHPEYIHSGSVTPKSFLRKVRVTRPSQFLLPPYCGLTASDLEEAVYAEVIKHSSDSVDSKIKHIRVIDIDGRWVTLEELANSVKEGGQVSNNVAEMHIRTLADSVPPRKIIFPWLLSVYLLLGDTKSKCLIKYFRRDVNYILSHQHQLLFPTLQKLGSTPKEGHWFVLCLNLKAKRFEVLDSLRTEDDPSLILHATKLMNGVKKAWLLSYKDSSKQIQDYDLVYIDVFKQDNGVDCGFFAFKILEFWDGKNIPAITQDQIPALRKILTSMWLEHPRNKCKQWRYHLFNQK